MSTLLLLGSVNNTDPYLHLQPDVSLVAAPKSILQTGFKNTAKWMLIAMQQDTPRVSTLLLEGPSASAQQQAVSTLAGKLRQGEAV